MASEAAGSNARRISSLARSASTASTTIATAAVSTISPRSTARMRRTAAREVRRVRPLRRHDDDADGEERAHEHAEGRVAVDPGDARGEREQHSREHAERERPREQRLADDEGDGDAGEDRVRERVADEGQPAEQHEDAHDAGQHPSTTISTSARCMYGSRNGSTRIRLTGRSRVGRHDGRARSQHHGSVPVGLGSSSGDSVSAIGPKPTRRRFEEAGVAAGEVGDREVVRGHHDADPRSAQPPEDGDQHVGGRGVEAVNGSSSSRRRASWATARARRDALALATRQPAEPLVGPVAEPDLVERGVGGGTVGRPGPAAPADGAVAAHRAPPARP